MQSLHRARERWVRNRTALLNKIRGLLLERGITIRKGRRHAEEALPTTLEDAEANLTGMMRQLLARLASELKQLEVQIAEIDAMIAGKADDQKACQRLMAIPGRAQGTRSKGQSLLETAIAINLVAALRLSPRACSSALETHPASLSLFLLPLFVMLGKVIVARHVLDAWKKEHPQA
jgi:transposase